jgi:hypothetical protein
VTPPRRTRKKRADELRLTRAEKLVLLGAALAFAVISYLITTVLVRRAAEHERERARAAPTR